ncbi:cytochrome P450 [Cubamyces menziesii]|nr:cytochrome P450 [Cubamyces menziesii]
MSPAGPSQVFVPLALAIFTLILIRVRSYLDWKARSKGRPLPPGPRPWPVIANILHFPRLKPWRGFLELTERYGSIVHLHGLRDRIVFIGNAEVADELLNKRSANTSDRPRPVVAELSGQDVNFGTFPYDQWWRRHRRSFWQQFHPGAISQYLPTQQEGTHKFLAALLESPSSLRENIAYIALRSGSQATPGHFLVQEFPFLRHLPSWVPGASFKKDFAESKDANYRLKNELFDEVKVAIVRIFLSSSDTAGYTLEGFFLAMAMHPDVQKKAQAELDEVIGPNRLPEHSDSAALLYINAVLKETLRWHVAMPLGFWHRAIADDECNGYFIPGGQTKMIAGSSIDAYENPDDFCPERFIKDGSLDPTVRDPADYMFGLPLDDDGKPISIEYTETHGMLSRPEDLRCTIKPRSAAAEALIREAQRSAGLSAGL